MAKKEPASRIAILREQVEAAEKERGPTFDVPFRGRQIPLRKIRIKTDFPLYRIQSGRTHRAQCQYLEEHTSASKDFFADPEDLKVQKAQHQILLRLITEKDLDADLKQRGQRDPLVLTHDGYVLDGNRRLAALRDESEEYVEAVVLPADAQSHEIYETEIELQMQKETKAPYNWIDQGIHIEYGIKNLNEKLSIVAKRMRMTEDQVKRELEKLALVRAYLSWLGEEGKYHKVPSAGGGHMEQAFIEMVSRLASPTVKRKSEREKQLIRELCFAAIKEEAGYKQIRDIIKHSSQNPAKIAEKLRDRIPVSKPIEAGNKLKLKGVSEHTDPLRAIAKVSRNQESPVVDRLLEAISDGKNAPKVLDIVEDLEAEEKESKRQQLPLQRIQRAINDLQQIELTKDAQDIADVAKALEKLQKEVERLSTLVNKLSKK
ncbi:MAG: hypothetical protein C4576_04935 [Desulfobacteraceae bacterium]|nr:MAG: hypothetical protein C4576_04935 [Desulfobacteraceae bacterium]